MFEAEPGWVELPSGAGSSTVGVWRAAVGDSPVVIKRLSAPSAHDPVQLSDPRHSAYWRREADVLSTGITLATAGLCATSATVEEDFDGITITREWIEDAAVTGLFVAMSLGRFAASDLARTAFLSRDLLRTRLAATQRRAGGWPTLARTTVADIADSLWARRGSFLDALDALPQVPQHGDPTLANVPGRRGDDALAIDWATLGTGPVGGDVGFFSLGAREEFEPLLDAYLMGMPTGVAAREDVVLGAQITAVYTALGRAEWALARVASGEGALASKYRHPAVAPHLRTLQRQFTQIEALLGW